MENGPPDGSELTNQRVIFRLSEKEADLIAILRDVQFGKFEVVMQNGQPDRVTWIRESIKLGNGSTP